MKVIVAPYRSSEDTFLNGGEEILGPLLFERATNPNQRTNFYEAKTLERLERLSHKGTAYQQTYRLDSIGKDEGLTIELR